MKRSNSSDDARLQFIQNHEEDIGPLGDCAPRSVNWEVSKVALLMTQENFDPHVLRSPGILSDPELFEVAEQIHFLLGELQHCIIDKELSAEGLSPSKRRKWKLQFE